MTIELFFGTRGWKCPKCGYKIRPRGIGNHISKCPCGFKVQLKTRYKQVTMYEIEIESIKSLSTSNEGMELSINSISSQNHNQK